MRRRVAPSFHYNCGKLEVVGLNRVENHEDEMTLVNKGHTEGSRLSKMALAHLLLVSSILLDELEWTSL